MNDTAPHESQEQQLSPQPPQALGLLVVCRHAESEWNKLGRWTGLTDVGLSEAGKAAAVETGKVIRAIPFDHVYTSSLRRTQETLAGIYQGMGVDMPEYQTNDALNERDYGELTGKNKWEVQQSVGDEQFQAIRRGWAADVPGGENLQMVYDRLMPFFDSEIRPKLKAGEKILIVSHGNTIRALMKSLDNLTPEDIEHIEMPFNHVLFYTFDADHDQPVSKEIKAVDIELPHA